MKFFIVDDDPGMRESLRFEGRVLAATVSKMADGWYVANPDLTVTETRRLKRIGKAVDEFLDKVSA